MASDPLEGVDEIHWDELDHAYGGAEDVPGKLRSLLDPDGDADTARDLAMGSLWHQGTVYSATAAAIPFLAKMLAAPEVHGRGAIAAGLVLMARSRDAVVLAALDGASADLRKAAARYGELAAAVRAIMERSSDDDVLDGLEDLEIDPPAPPSSWEAPAARAPEMDDDAFERLAATWDPLHGAERERWPRMRKLEEMCRATDLPRELEHLARPFESLFVQLHLGIVDTLNRIGMRIGGIRSSVIGFQTSLGWSRPSPAFALYESLGPERVLAKKLGHAKPSDGFELARENGRFVLSCSVPIATGALTFDAFLRAVARLHAERDRLLAFVG